MEIRLNTNWPAVLLLWLIGLLAAGQFAKIAVMLPEVAALYEAGTQAAWAISMNGIAGLIFGATAGAVIARVGPRRALVAGMVLGGVMSLGQALTMGFEVLLFLRFVEGFAHLAIVIATPVLMVNAAARRHHTVVMGLWGMFFGVGFALSASLAPGLLALGGVAAVLVAHGGALLVMAALVPLLVDRIPPATPERRSWLAEHVAIYTNPRLLAPGLGFLWHTFMFLALLTFLPPLVAPGQVWFAGALPLVALGGTFVGGVIARQISPRWIASASFAGTAVLMIALWLAPPGAQMALALLLIAVVGFAPGAMFAAIPVLNDDPRDQARAGGALAQMGNLGTTSGPAIYAVVLASAGLGGIAALTVLLCVVGIAALALVFGRIVSIAPSGD